jgi:hypothetical protein
MAELNRNYVRKRGEDLPQSKVTEEDVRQMRELYEAGKAAYARWRDTYTVAAIARKWDISQAAADKILRRETWSHV